jgi:hypothetical protein
LGSAGKYSKNVWYLLLLLLIFGLLGGVAGDAIGQNFKALSFLKEYMTIGLTKPLVLDLRLIHITFGLSFNVSILSLCGLFVGFLVYRKL